MEFITDIEVRLETGETKDTHTFANENVEISRASHLWIKNNGSVVSEFIETVKLWHKMDGDTGLTSYYLIKTSEMTPVQRTTYKVKSINEEKQAIMFEEV